MLSMRMSLGAIAMAVAFVSPITAQQPAVSTTSWADSLGRTIERASAAGDEHGLLEANALAQRLLDMKSSR